MFEVGRLCVKLAGRDAGKKCVVVDVLDSVYVLIDGQTRRRKCNIRHLEPTETVLKIKKNSSHEDVAKILKDHDIEVRETKPKEKVQRPKRTPGAGEKKETVKKEKKAPKKKADKKK